MNYAEICIIKRDGKREDFSISKIKNAISKAFSATGIQDEQQLVADITMNVISQFTTPTITVEEIQDLVEKSLMKVRPEVAKKYIIYREWRNTERDKKTQMKQVMDGIVAIDKNDVSETIKCFAFCQFLLCLVDGRHHTEAEAGTFVNLYLNHNLRSLSAVIECHLLC